MNNKMKQCTKCKEWKEKEDFCKNKRKKDNLNNCCKQCVKEYKENNKEKLKEYNKEYKENNKEKIKEYNKEYQQNNKEQKKEYWNSPLTWNTKGKLKEEISKYEEIRESENGNLEVKCIYCNDWFEPTFLQLQNRLDAINGKAKSEGTENRLYCSYKCKHECPIYNQRLYEKDNKPATSREVQPALRKLVLERDNWTCKKCNTHKDDLEVGIHCHHILPINESPIESADIDNCITLCVNCHKEVHQIPGCGYHESRC